MVRGDGRRSRARLVALAVGLPLLATGLVLAVVFTVTGALAPSPLHRAVDEYLDVVGRGGPVPGAAVGCPEGAADPAAVLHGLAGTFGHDIVSSTESGGDASVNVDLTPPEGGPIAVVLELHRADDRWLVCAASTGRVAIDADPF
ncbi:hypothetical protein ACFYYB_06010 [Streptomyces sp. NPDC002886]|uniref:hypothetical protein n=1 Tax=Streptomyces sp. NPDC002886 TaxID=3364667 RepID=UPI0036910A79